MYQEKVAETLTKEGITKPTMIQEQTYEAIKAGQNLVALAKTGTGKTLAYALPALENTMPGAKNSLVIIAPTTELAVQIRQAINPYIAALGLTGISLVGAGNRKRQEDTLKKRHPEVVVATPGRFFDLFSSNRIKTAEIKTLIIDEADDVLEFGKLELISALGQNLAVDAQILLFGATSSRITDEAEKMFARPFQLVDVRPQQQTTSKNYFLQVDNAHKIEFLQRLTQLDHFRGILFFDSNQAMMRFAGIFAHTKTQFTLLTSEFNKKRQQEALQAFKRGKSKLLIATDVAARGLDIPGLTYVINFDIPREVNTYLHRAGRTGRMGKIGYVVTLGDDHDLRDLKKLLAGKIALERVYFAGFKLTTKRPRVKKKQGERNITVTSESKTVKTRHRKRRNKNKGYHPHYLKKGKE
ncbi:DEAD/DEAH box helicase [Lactobacillus sp. ESL0791]|uniref:DEAD/DEAH box helicase n=1 Tax=Lactobacillus sp. ESL0791 TaxID=2983234 RepID=UPI0023F7AB2D|nr:DEAD/DEAH box helicase [Lactobacillus sp. ESL0791]MDF7639213.1 DEAD/DEAH box helicase [Lactobacillus sp. ESL0791]